MIVNTTVAELFIAFVSFTIADEIAVYATCNFTAKKLS